MCVVYLMSFSQECDDGNLAVLFTSTDFPSSCFTLLTMYVFDCFPLYLSVCSPQVCARLRLLGGHAGQFISCIPEHSDEAQRLSKRKKAWGLYSRFELPWRWKHQNIRT